MNQHSYITQAVTIAVRQTVIPYTMMDILIVLYVTILVAGSYVTIVADKPKQLCLKEPLLD
jgi:hypothetical protein